MATITIDEIRALTWGCPSCGLVSTAETLHYRDFRYGHGGGEPDPLLSNYPADGAQTVDPDEFLRCACGANCLRRLAAG